MILARPQVYDDKTVFRLASRDKFSFRADIASTTLWLAFSRHVTQAGALYPSMLFRLTSTQISQSDPRWEAKDFCSDLAHPQHSNAAGTGR